MLAPSTNWQNNRLNESYLCFALIHAVLCDKQILIFKSNYNKSFPGADYWIIIVLGFDRRDNIDNLL